MLTVDRYILATFGKSLAVVLLALVSLYSLIEFLEKVDDFIEHQANLTHYLLYPLHHLPTMLSNALPMAVLLATFATVGSLSRTSQLTAMLVGGISFNRISRPLFLGSLLLSGLVFLANLWLVPWSAREAEYILETEIKGKGTQTVSKQDLYFRDHDRIVSAAHAFPTKGLIVGLTIVEFNDHFQPLRRIQAEQAQHVEDGKWQLINAVTWKFSPETRALASFDKTPKLTFDLQRRPEEMLQLWKDPTEMTFGELLHFTEKLSQEGHDPKPYQVETHMRIARSATPLIMVLLGIPFALQRGRNASFALGIVTSLIIFLVYFLLYAVFAAFGAAAILPPVLAAWAANILMALIGTWFFLRVQG